MRVAFFSDIHANLPALEAALDDARAHGATHLINLGDVVGYGPEPAECVARVRTVASASVLGNHDAAACGLLDPKRFNAFARETAERAALALDGEAREWLASLPYVLEGDGFACVHGSFEDPESFHYLETKEDAALSLAAMPGQRLLVVGHTHLPCIYAEEGGVIRQLTPEDVLLRPSARYVVNPGSIGFPRGDRLTADYLLYDTVTGLLAFRAVAYDLAPYRLALVRNGYNPLNYWFLSPSARRRRAEQAFLNPSRASDAPLKGPFRPRHRKVLPNTAWTLLVVLALLLLVGVVFVFVYSHPATSPVAPAVARLAEPAPDMGLLPPLVDWTLSGGAIEGHNYVLTPARPRVTTNGSLTSDLIELPKGAKRLRLAFEVTGTPTDNLSYSARVLFLRDNGSQRKDDLHEYKTFRESAYTITVPKDATQFRVLFEFTTPVRLTLTSPSLTVVE